MKRTIEEYQEALGELSYTALFYLEHTYYPMSSIMEEKVDIKTNTDLIKELIDKQTPKKPLHQHELKQFGNCPVCMASVNQRINKGFCGACGKALTWSGEENIK